MAKKERDQMAKYSAKLEMTPMIDVVFQLLIFFIVTLKQQDILSRLNVSRPAPDVPQNKMDDIKLLSLEIGSDSWVLNGRRFSGNAGLDKLDRSLSKLASFNKNASLLIKCTADSPQSKLVQVLNICARENMGNISVFSM